MYTTVMVHFQVTVLCYVVLIHCIELHTHTHSLMHSLSHIHIHTRTHTNTHSNTHTHTHTHLNTYNAYLGGADFSKDFFSKPAYLTVSGS